MRRYAKRSVQKVGSEGLLVCPLLIERQSHTPCMRCISWWMPCSGTGRRSTVRDYREGSEGVFAEDSGTEVQTHFASVL